MKFPGEKYRIKLFDVAKPVVHALQTVQVQVMPLYKTELERKLAEDIISPISEPTDCVNSIVCNVRDLANGAKTKVAYASILATLTRTYAEKHLLAHN